jgi:hypothetical protein
MQCSIVHAESGRAICAPLRWSSLVAPRFALRDGSPPRHAKRASGAPGLRRKERIFSFAFPAFRFAQSGINPRPTTPFSSQARLGTVPRSPLAKAGLKARPENTSRPAARDRVCMRRTVWNPTLRKKARRMGHRRDGELGKSGKGRVTPEAKLLQRNQYLDYSITLRQWL